MKLRRYMSEATPSQLGENTEGALHRLMPRNDNKEDQFYTPFGIFEHTRKGRIWKAGMRFRRQQEFIRWRSSLQLFTGTMTMNETHN